MKLIHTYPPYLPFAVSLNFNQKLRFRKSVPLHLLCVLLIFSSLFLHANNFDPIAGAKYSVAGATLNGECYIKFPNDTVVTHCNSTGVYGVPEFGGVNCGQMLVTYQDQILQTAAEACFRIERTWFIRDENTFDSTQVPLCITVPNPQPDAVESHPINRLGPIVSPVQDLGDPWKSTIVKITPSDSVATNYAVFYDPNANCYYYKQIICVIDIVDPVVHCPQSPTTFCDSTGYDPMLWNAAYWWDAGNQSHDLCEAPVEICLTATDSCYGGDLNFEYQLYLDLNDDGTMETVVNSGELGAQPNGLGWNNLLYNNTQGPGEARSFDFRPVPADQKWGFALEETVSGNNKTACVKFNTQANPNTFAPVQLPHGTHKIKWYVSDDCGNQTVCEYVIIVKDCKPPTVVCNGTFSVNLPVGQIFTLNATDCPQYVEDNCSLTPYIQYGIRKCNSGTTGFPLDANGNPITKVMFNCTELGTQCVELWAMDRAGNADHCEMSVIIQDNGHNCAGGLGTHGIQGRIETSQSEGVEKALIRITSSSPIIFIPPLLLKVDTTDKMGIFMLDSTLSLVSSFVITPEKDDDPLNGVTTYDLVLISKHILATNPLYDPYSLIAADANRSNSITTFDIVELRKLILGIYQHLPANKSWRFVSKAQVFHNPYNPFADTLQESITLGFALANLPNLSFVGVKIGDVNNTVIAHNLTAADDRRVGTLLFDVYDRDVKAGEIFEVTFQAAEQTQGYQMTLDFNGLEIVGAPFGNELDASNFGLFSDAVTVSAEGADAFTVGFRALRTGRLSEMLGLSSRITWAEAYAWEQVSESEPRVMDVGLRFHREEMPTLGFELYPNQPNPFARKTQIRFHLPEASRATVNVFDGTGRPVLVQEGEYEKGYNSILLDFNDLDVSGLLFLRLETASGTGTLKMMSATPE